MAFSIGYQKNRFEKEKFDFDFVWHFAYITSSPFTMSDPNISQVVSSMAAMQLLEGAQNPPVEVVASSNGISVDAVKIDEQVRTLLNNHFTHNNDI